ncbi:MAG: helix-turn-helix transcriptional regulator [Sulfurimonas sp.]|nr:helix-turn-helix transcriptional regulator [Sulfurimonas sp.]
MKNIVKYVCNELDITQKALAEEIGVSEGTVNRWSAKPDEVPLQTQKTLKILLENSQLKENQEKIQKAISLLEEVKNTQNISI